MSTIRLPNESPEYRSARDELLQAEMALREQVEEVAARRRDLPPGGALKEDYVFEERVDGEVRTTRLSELFADGQDTLFIYSFMYSPSMEAACPGCTAILDALDGQVRHLDQTIGTAVVARHSVDALRAHADSRGWRRLRLLSWANNTYGLDYFAEIDGRQITNANVFHRTDDGIRHFWNSELSFAPGFRGGHPRHLDLMWPLWNVLDMTPGGRGDFGPRLSYD